MTEPDNQARKMQIEQAARELALALRSDNTAQGEAWAKTVEGVAKAACDQ